MNPTTPAPMTGHNAPKGRPDRLAILNPMLEGTKRGGVGIRSEFLQTPYQRNKRQTERAAALSRLMRDERALDAYLLIHALASSSEPYDTWFPSSTWVQVARLDEAAEMGAAKSRWAKLVTRLVDAKLLVRAKSGNKMSYVLLHESGSGEQYTRPKKLSDGAWFSLPYIYWTEGWDKILSLPEKAMLLISLDQPDDFRMPADRGPAWYGISETTVRRGFRGLVSRGILERREEVGPDPKSPTGWKETFYYTAVGPWAYEERKAAMLTSLRPRVTVAFDSDEEAPA